MSKEDKVSTFLRTIPKDSKNGELVIAKGIIEGDRSWFPTLIGSVIFHLFLSIESREPGVPDAKCTTSIPVPALGKVPASVGEPVEHPAQLRASVASKAEKWWRPLKASIMIKRSGTP